MSWVQATLGGEHTQRIYSYGKAKTSPQQSQTDRGRCCPFRETLQSGCTRRAAGRGHVLPPVLQQIQATPPQYLVQVPAEHSTYTNHNHDRFRVTALLRHGRRGLARDRIHASLLILCTCTRSTCNRSVLPEGKPGTLTAGGQRGGRCKRRNVTKRRRVLPGTIVNRTYGTHKHLYV